MKERSHDVIAFIKDQHREIKGLFAQVLEAQDAKRERLFAKLKTLLTVHEAAEDEVVHSEARKVNAGGAAEVAARETEESAAKVALEALSKLDVGSPEFESKIRALQKAVLSHAQTEESEELDALGKNVAALPLWCATGAFAQSEPGRRNNEEEIPRASRAPSPSGRIGRHSRSEAAPETA